MLASSPFPSCREMRGGEVVDPAPSVVWSEIGGATLDEEGGDKPVGVLVRKN